MAPPGSKRAEKPRFFPRSDSPYGLKHAQRFKLKMLQVLPGRMRPSADAQRLRATRAARVVRSFQSLMH